MKVEESLNVTFDEIPPPTKLSPLVDDDVGEEEAIKNNTKVVNNNNEEDESIEVDEVVNIKEFKNHPLDQAITTPRITQAQLLRDPNKLYIDDIRLDLKGWELFFKENFFCSIDKRNKVKACTAYMLYYLTIRRKFNFTSMIIYRMEEVIKKRKGPMPFAMLLTRLYNHILATNPQAIVPIARFTFHEHVMDPLDISRNPSTEKGKKIASPPVISSSSSSSDDNEAPSFLEFYDELSDNLDELKTLMYVETLYPLDVIVGYGYCYRRPDIVFSVCLCAHFQENPKTTHLEAVKCIFRYIRGTSHLGLWNPKETRIETVVYADSDHAAITLIAKALVAFVMFMDVFNSLVAKKPNGPDHLPRPQPNMSSPKKHVNKHYGYTKLSNDYA
ncbi:hypothetical protein Tco_0911468 [Tanacetum coccineum]|uniref:Reverse transcriptase Ty1/copia-type domain-containing protein n=1 Tax=Tanacetum coccineum TaxID=301880 RepID=A0ABQ5CWV8_9ASTR